MARTASRPTTQKTAEKAPVKSKRSWLGPIIGILAVGALAALVVLDPEPPGVEYPNLGNFHLSAIDEPHTPYNSAPPSSGPHFGGIAPWGVSDEVFPAELFVHNLEDGGVVLLYNCADGCSELQSGIETLVEDTGRSSLAAPYDGPIFDAEGTDYAAAAVVWNRVFYFDELTTDVRSELETFISLYMGVDHHATGGAVGGHTN